jgi:F420-dependent oxidoreductase-like protein
VPEFAIKTPPQNTTWSDMLAIWRAADDIDVFTEAWNFDHFYPLHPPLGGPCLESWTTLAALAQATRRLRVGSMVNGMHYRHPAVTANMAASLDIISGGRLNLGLGAGWFEPESKAYGIPLGTLTERMDRFDEGVEVVHRLLTQEHTTFAGRFYELVEARCEPKPIQQPRPPIVIGGKGEKRTLRTVARFADYWDAMFHEDTTSWLRLNDVLRARCDEVGRDPSEIRRSVHLRWDGGADPAPLADEAMKFGEAGVDVIVFSMKSPQSVAAVEPLANALAAATR